MRVGFGVTNLLRGLTGSGVDGIGTYTSEIFQALKDKPNIKLYPFAAGEYDFRAVGFDYVAQSRILPVELAKALINPRYSYEKRISGEKLDLIHATDHVIPVVRNLPLVSTVMDVIPLTNPEWLRTSTASSFKQYAWKQVAKQSDHIITISEFSKQEIAKTLDFDTEKISVVPLGVNEVFFRRIDHIDIDTVLNKYGLSRECFFLNVGTLQPRKNVARIIAAMEQLPQEIRLNYPLVIVGKNGWGNEELSSKIKKAEAQGWCKWLKRISDMELRALLQSSTAMIFPSLCEGFGLPVLEAFASSTPVIASNTSALPEVTAGHAWMVDPVSTESIRQAIQLLAVDRSALTNEKIEAGFMHAKQLTWSVCAMKTQEVYLLVAGQ